MKKTILMMCLFGGMNLSNSFAQVTVIPKIGVSLAKQTNIDTRVYETIKRKVGLVEGIAVNVPLYKNVFSLQPELLYIQKGYIYEVNAPSFPEFNGQSSWQINYLELPILARLEKNYKIFKGYIYAGPSLSYGLRGNITSSDSSSIFQSKVNIVFKEGNSIVYDKKTGNYYLGQTFYAKEFINRLDIGLQFGGGIGILVGPGVVLLDSRLGVGLSRFYKKDNDFFKGSEKNIVWAFTMGYALTLHKRNN